MLQSCIGCKPPQNFQINPVRLEVIFSQKDHDNVRISAQPFKSSTKEFPKACESFIRVPDDLLEISDPRYRPMCVPNIQLGSCYKTWKLNQRTQNKDAFQKIMLQHAFLPFSLILLLLTKLKKGKER